MPYLKIHIPYDPAIPFLGIYPNEMKYAYETVSCMLMFTEAQFTKHPSVDYWIKKMWNKYVMEYYSAIKQ